MQDHANKTARFLALHQQKHPLLLANAWDVGSAKLLASLGFEALATTSGGYAATLGRSTTPSVVRRRDTCRGARGGD